ncbi:MAG: hypothetical protein Q7R31_03605 [Candidatus Levybacteria bacterium]|nr:hypothetical protein [Candidatus Levybacteria bacterium]
MLEFERRFSAPQSPEFQPIIGYREFEKSPWIVVKQTNALLELFNKGVIRKPGPAKEYFRDYTFQSYLTRAEEGSAVLYDDQKQSHTDVDLETREATRHALVVFAWMRDRTKSPFLPKGFSRKGMLKPPMTQEEFMKRIREMKITILQVVEGNIQSHVTPEAHPAFLRTFKFFEVGSDLPIKLAPDEKEREKIAKDKFNDLLRGIDISLE